MSRLTYVGHATVWLEIDGTRLLTDPFLGGGVLHLRRQRGRRPALTGDDVDVVLLSHLHHDHCDIPSLRRLGLAMRLIVPRGAGDWLRRKGFTVVTEVSPGDTIDIAGLRVIATPAHHLPGRALFGPRSETVGFIVDGTRRVYFAGDTDIFPEMQAFSEALDLALLPVWGWGPTLGPGHLNPRRAAEALRLLRPRLAVPIHWGTIAPIGMAWLQPRFLVDPPHDFLRYAQETAPETRVEIVPPGDTLDW